MPSWRWPSAMCSSHWRQRLALLAATLMTPPQIGCKFPQGYAAIHGLPEGTKVSTGAAWQSRALPEDRERINSLRLQVFRDQRGEYSTEYRIVRAGEVRWIESRSFISYKSDGRPQRVIGVNIDITERKRLEERQRIL